MDMAWREYDASDPGAAKYTCRTPRIRESSGWTGSAVALIACMVARPAVVISFLAFLSNGSP